MHSLVVAAASSDIDQSLVVVIAFLLILTAWLILAAYLEPGAKPKPLHMREDQGKLVSSSSETADDQAHA